MNEKSQDQINQEVHDALFGANGEMGLIQKTDEIWEILSAFKLFGRAVMWVALLLGAIGAFWAAVGGWVKHVIFNR